MRWLLIVCLMVPTWALAQGSQASKRAEEKKSLADVARQSRDTRAKSGKSPRVITNADLKNLKAKIGQGQNLGGPSEAGEEIAYTEEQVGEEPETEELSEERLDEIRQAFAQARDDLRMAVNEGLVLQLRMNNLRNAYLSQSDGSRQERLQFQLQETLQLIEQNKQKQLEARQALRSLQNDARAAGLSDQQVEELTGQLPGESPEVVSPESVGGQ